MSLRAALFRAVIKGDRKSVASLLASGADVNSQNDGGQTPIILAIISGHDHILPMLSDFGADPFLKDQTGLNAIDWAERKGRIDLVKGFQKDRQSKPPVNNETPPQPNTSSDQMSNRATVDAEKSRQYVAGLLRRFEETPPKRIERQPQTISSPDVNKSPGVDRSTSASAETESSTIPADEIPRRVSNEQLTNRIESPAPTESELKVSDQPVAANLQSTEISPTGSRSSKKRCPQCNTVYNSDLLTYCAYHVVPLVDYDTPIVIRSDSKTSSVLLWTLVLFTLFAAAIATAYLSERFFRPSEKPAETALSQSAHLEGIPAAKGGLAQKAVLLPVAKAPLDAAKETATVEVSIRVNRLGQVTDASSSSENQILRESALEAARRATFSPEKLNSRGATGIITYTFNP